MKLKINFNIPLQPGDIITTDPIKGMQYIVDEMGFLQVLPKKERYSIDTSEFHPGTKFVKVNHSITAEFNPYVPIKDDNQEIYVI